MHSGDGVGRIGGASESYRSQQANSTSATPTQQKTSDASKTTFAGLRAGATAINRNIGDRLVKLKRAFTGDSTIKSIRSEIKSAEQSLGSASSQMKKEKDGVVRYTNSAVEIDKQIRNIKGKLNSNKKLSKNEKEQLGDQLNKLQNGNNKLKVDIRKRFERQLNDKRFTGKDPVKLYHRGLAANFISTTGDSKRDAAFRQKVNNLLSGNGSVNFRKFGALQERFTQDIVKDQESSLYTPAPPTSRGRYDPAPSRSDSQSGRDLGATMASSSRGYEALPDVAMGWNGSEGSTSSSRSASMNSAGSSTYAPAPAAGGLGYTAGPLPSSGGPSSSDSYSELSLLGRQPAPGYTAGPTASSDGSDSAASGPGLDSSGYEAVGSDFYREADTSRNASGNGTGASTYETVSDVLGDSDSRRSSVTDEELFGGLDDAIADNERELAAARDQAARAEDAASDDLEDLMGELDMDVDDR